MSAKVVCFASAKGGAGKTVITATVGTFLAAIGKRVLLIDTDAATNGLTLLYIKEVTSQAAQRHEMERSSGLFEDMDTNKVPSRFRVTEGLDFLPATYHFVNTESLATALFEQRLTATLKLCREDYDYILLDAQAGADAFASIAMRKDMSDVVVLVSEYDPMSAAGIERLKALMPDDLTYARTWILMNKVLPEFAKHFSDFLEVARYLSPIPWDADVVRAYARRRLALDIERGNTFTLAIVQTVRGLLSDEIESDIKKWLETRADAIRQPIEDQYNDLERELSAIINAAAVWGRRKSLRFTISLAAIVSIALLITIGLVRGRLLDNLVFSFLDSSFLVITSVVIITLLIHLVDRLRSAEVNASVEQSRMARRREVIEISLRKLEMLRTADPESLIGSSDRI